MDDAVWRGPALTRVVDGLAADAGAALEDAALAACRDADGSSVLVEAIVDLVRTGVPVGRIAPDTRLSLRQLDESFAVGASWQVKPQRAVEGERNGHVGDDETDEIEARSHVGAPYLSAGRPVLNVSARFAPY